MVRVRWGEVAVFYALACAWSWPLFAWRDVANWQGFPLPVRAGAFLIMWGPGVAAIVCTLIFQRRARTSLLGAAPARSIGLVGALLGFVILVAWFTEGAAAAGAALALAPMAVGRTLGEELGWRGFLHDALRPLPTWARFGLVGVLWELWHFTTRTWDRTPGQAIVVVGMFVAGAIALSFLAGWMVDRTGSVLAGVAVHLAANMILEDVGLASVAIIGLSLAAWAVILPRATSDPTPTDAARA